MGTSETAARPFDPDALREKYRQERDKRLRTDGTDQYQELTGRFARLMEDPYAQPAERAPLGDEVEVAIIGGGFGGLLIGARLREAGVHDLRIIDDGGDVGGTWYWNRYPGAACDTESYIYLPLLEETGYIPTEKYARAPEILAHARRIAEHYDLYRNAAFQTRVTELRWDDADAVWTVCTDRGDRFRARFVCMSNGPLNRPKLPGVPGIEAFKGHTFHTSRWDYAYTGGDSYGNLTGLRDKRVGIIGTGATAVQCVPHLGESAKHLYVFQRTPSSVDVRGNRPTDPDWAASLEPGWQKRRMENFSTLISGGRADEDLVMDGWTEIFGILSRRSGRYAATDPAQAALNVELADFEKMEQVRARAEAIVEDPETAEALKPYYRQFCKRPCFHDEYLPTFNRANVTLVDTQGRGIERLTERGIIANGVEYELDCIIFASGFEWSTPLERRNGYHVYGRGGQTLTEKWQDGIATLFGMQTRGFPNCFIVSMAQVGFSANFPHMLEEQSRHIAYVVQQSREREVRALDVSEEAEAGWVEQVIAGSIDSVKFLEACTPGYYNNEGQPNSVLVRQNGSYGPGIIAFGRLLDEWRREGSLAGLEIDRA
ncbi:MAG TPA: NAD(P)/FAD-dependent oxidoreductase [Dehalococcoidia bacterium]|nr:NAD(P)/FAD-dependent oxidoreductase [Dehalococcoidia bacterium]